ncbi:MAG TPA: 16S rRNA (cytosine(1402)-N(4))-methyltransferase RsmH [Candidatus Fraserbacteria bacterium]|nr:16S rRNA (cytosine(1402)-N(4))-methyltransferase RsmH [Candidatus Fraserbacteria bacterium]
MHRPVLLSEAIERLSVRPDGLYLDATVGAGGHALEIVRRLKTGRLIGLDLDPEALELAGRRLADYQERVTLLQANFRDLGRALAELHIEKLDGVLFDLGVSSMQFDRAERGFSFRHDAPLDMRLDPSGPLNARQLVNESSRAELARILCEYGEERYAERIATQIVRARQRAPGGIQTTGQLAKLITEAIPWPARRHLKIHPATRSFQALRIAVNDELGNLRLGLAAALAWLKIGGVLVVISFHSLEDRIVKRFLREQARGCLCPPGLPQCICGHRPALELLSPARPSEDEISANPRARSARLRAGRRVTN